MILLKIVRERLENHMAVTVLAVGDVCAQAGLDVLRKKLWSVRRHYNVDFCIVNGENASGIGITPNQARDIFEAGADVITLGNHSFSRREIADFLDDNEYIIRPANYGSRAPGQGYTIFDDTVGKFCVINLSGQVDMKPGLESPFYAADNILKKIPSDVKNIIVDMHAEATSEKYALGYYLDGRVSAVFGTHTHVQTADEHILAGGTGYITDIGMTGATDSVLGMSKETSLRFFLGDPIVKLEPARGPSAINGVIFDLDNKTGKCLKIERVNIS